MNDAQRHIHNLMIDNVTLSSPMPLFVENFAARAAGKRAAAIDMFMGARIREQTPVLHWILRFRIFQNRYVAKIFGLRIESRRLISKRGTLIRIMALGRSIGTMEILEPELL